MSLKFEKAKRRFDVTAKVQVFRGGKWEVVYESTSVLWSHGPEMHNLLEPICAAANVPSDKARVAILYVREHRFHEYTPPQMGKMMAQEGYGYSDNPYVNDDHAQADAWADAFQKEMRYIVGRRR